MNKTRRKSLMDAKNLLEMASNIISDVHDEEEECYENTPENLTTSDRFFNMEDAIDNMEDASSSIDLAIEFIEKASQ